MLDQKTKERITAEETARFMDTQFGQLDLSGSPDLNHPPADRFELQDRHGFNRVDDAGLAGINQLKALLANPPRDVMEELARETNNPDLVYEVAQDRAEHVANEFRRRNPGYMKCDANWRSVVETLAHNFLREDDLDAEEAQDLLISAGYWTVENLTAAYKALDKIGALEYPSNHNIISSSYADSHGAAQLSSINAAARLPTFLSLTSRPRSSSGLSSENTLFICPECFRKAETMRFLPRGVRATIRTRRSSALSTRLTRPFAARRSTAILIEPGVRSTIGPIVLTGNGPLCSRTSSTAKSERPSPVSSIPAAAYLLRARIAFIITSQTWSISSVPRVIKKPESPRSIPSSSILMSIYLTPMQWRRSKRRTRL